MPPKSVRAKPKSIPQLGARILEVDDAEDIAEVIKRGPEEKGFSVGVYTYPEVALSDFKNYWTSCPLQTLECPR